MDSAFLTMFNGTKQAESACNNIHIVWYSAIFITSSDFNNALTKLEATCETDGTYSNLRENKNKVTTLITKLKNPSSANKAEYNDLVDIYSKYIKITDMALSPTGSLQPYTDNFNSLDGDMSAVFQLTLYNKPVPSLESRSLNYRNGRGKNYRKQKRNSLNPIKDKGREGFQDSNSLGLFI